MRDSKEKNKKRNNGDGNWRILPSGQLNWCRVYTAENGKKGRLSVTGKDRTECRKRMKEKEKQFETLSRMDLSTKGFLEDNMEEWLLNVKQKDPDCGDTSFPRILSTFNTHVKGSYLGKMKEEEVSDKDINLFLSELKKHDNKGKVLEAPLSYSSKKKVYELLDMYFSRKYIRASERNPMLTVPAPVKDKRYVRKEGAALVEDDDDEDVDKIVPLDSVWTDEEMLAIHEYCLRSYSPGKKGSVKRGPLIAALMWTTVRVGEFRALTWRDVHLEEGNAYISITKSWKKRGKEWYIGKPKTEKGVRGLQILPEAAEAFREYKRRFPPKSEDDFVCLNDDGKILCAKNFNDYLANILKGLGFDKIAGKNKTIHGLRHAGISYLIRHGMDKEAVAKYAGHASSGVTDRVYIEIINAYCKREIIKIGALSKEI